MLDDPESYVISKGWDYRPENDELVLHRCPFCYKEQWKFSIHKKMGLYQCFLCEARGNLLTLKRHCGDIAAVSKVEEVWGEDISYDVVPPSEWQSAHEAFLNDPTALQWWYTRGLEATAAERFKIGCIYTNEGRHLTIPYFKDDQCVNIKFRDLPPLPKGFKLKPKHEKPLYNVDAIKGKNDVFLVEGEIDCITMALMGFEGVTSLPNGADSFDHHHWDELIGRQKIYMVLDPDGAGRTGARGISTRLGADRCFDVKIPNGMDINELLVKFGWEEGKKRLEACIADAKPFGASEVTTVGGALQSLRDHILRTGGVENGFSSPWVSLNRIAGTIAPGEVILLLAYPKTGKTTLAQQWLEWLAERHRIPTMMYCLEMPLHRLAQSLVALVAQQSRQEISTLDVTITEFRLRGVPFYYGDIPKVWDFDHVKDVITYAVKRYGVQMICFDNLQLICRSVHNTFQEQGAVSRSFKQLAMELNIAIILVVQPKKPESTRTAPGMYDASGSGSFIADADGMISMYRKPLHTSDEEVTDADFETRDEASFAPEVLLWVPASRYRPGGRGALLFDGVRATFSDLEVQNSVISS